MRDSTHVQLFRIGGDCNLALTRRKGEEIFELRFDEIGCWNTFFSGRNTTVLQEILHFETLGFGDNFNFKINPSPFNSLVQAKLFSPAKYPISTLEAKWVQRQ